MKQRIVLGMATFLLFLLIVPMAAWAVPPPPPVGQLTDKVYNIVNPRGQMAAIPFVGLSPRLSTLEGKTIVVNQGEADAIIMPALIERLRASYPTTNWIYVAVSSFGPDTIESQFLASKPDAIIRGVAW
jgi:hypothetical protein